MTTPDLFCYVPTQQEVDEVIRLCQYSSSDYKQVIEMFRGRVSVELPDNAYDHLLAFMFHVAPRSAFKFNGGEMLVGDIYFLRGTMFHRKIFMPMCRDAFNEREKKHRTSAESMFVKGWK